MTFEEILDQAIAMLQRRRRVAYRTLQVQFHLDDNALEALKDELLYAQQVVQDEDGRVLVWTGGAGEPGKPVPPPPARTTQEEQVSQVDTPSAVPSTSEAERRQLTMLFCDLADSTRLAGQIDPEDYRTVVRAYQSVCAEIIQRFDGYIAQYLGDGLLVYFGYPQAHEDDAQRAVHAGLGMLEAMGTLNTSLVQDKGVRLAVRIGIHTGLVVVGEMGSGERHEHLALGDTPNVAARLQGFAAPDTVVISEVTARLVHGYFTAQDLGPHVLKGLDTPVRISQVVAASGAQSRLEAATATGLTPLVGREAEVALLRERWALSTDGRGQVVVLSGEAGIGKSRLVRVLTEQVGDAGTPRLTLLCSPYHTNSALYPVIEHLQRLLHWDREETADTRLALLEQALRTVHLPLAEVVPLLAALLSLPVPERYPPLTLSPQRQKQKTQEALVAWLLAEAGQQPVLAVWEDLHWADPSTLELLGILLDQVPTARLLMILTCRSEFQPPWAARSYMTPLSLTRLLRPQVEEMIVRVTDGKPLPADVVHQVVAKTDRIPLFVEELVKTILESGLVREEAGRYVLTGPLPPLAIPATLQDALMARLDRLAPVKEVAQLGAVLGREFTYELLRAVAQLDEAGLQRSLAQLIEAELLHQRGIPPQATYIFKHVLVQETAYQSLLRSTRQQYHQRIAQVLEAQFPQIVEIQPELLAHHYTEAGLGEAAIGYWQRAGERAIERSAYLEAIAHLSKELEILKTLLDTPARVQHELALQLALAGVLMATKGYAAPEVEAVYTRVHELSTQLGDTPLQFAVLYGLQGFHVNRGQLQTAREFVVQYFNLAQRHPNPVHLLRACHAMGSILLMMGEFTAAQSYLEQGIALYDAEHSRPRRSLLVGDPGVFCLCFEALVLWYLGCPEQARAKNHQARTFAQQLERPFSRCIAGNNVLWLQQLQRDGRAITEGAEAVIAFATEQGFPFWLTFGMIFQGWALAVSGQSQGGIARIHQGLATYQRTGGELLRPYFLALLAEASGKAGQTEEGLVVLADALAVAHNNEERFYEAELHRLQGELLLQQAVPDAQQVEACFQQALAIARYQQAKSLELRAAMSLSRLWQQQGKQAEARALLAPIYGWFTEGFDTVDLQEAKALLEALT